MKHRFKIGKFSITVTQYDSGTAEDGHSFCKTTIYEGRIKCESFITETSGEAFRQSLMWLKGRV